jgi:hypothetical protein
MHDSEQALATITGAAEGVLVVDGFFALLSAGATTTCVGPMAFAEVCAGTLDSAFPGESASRAPAGTTFAVFEAIVLGVVGVCC